jgi:polyisoprenoid-binding protein YceI
MNKFITVLALSVSFSALAQEAVVDLKAHPALSFKAKSTEVKGFATQNGDEVEAKDIVVGLKNISTGLGTRDTHTKKYLEVEKYPDAILVSAKGKGGQGEGVVRIHGIEKPVSGTYKVEGGKLNADFPIKLSDFGITNIKFMGAGVDDNAVVHVSVPIQAGTAAPFVKALEPKRPKK